jgi:hypothetical protein
VKREPIAEIGIGDLDIEDVFFLADVERWLEPGFIAVGVDLFFDVQKNLQPTVKFFFILH